MLPCPHMLKQHLAGFIRGNQVICLQSAQGGPCNNQFAPSSKRWKVQREVSQHKIEPKYVFVGLEILSSM